MLTNKISIPSFFYIGKNFIPNITNILSRENILLENDNILLVSGPNQTKHVSNILKNFLPKSTQLVVYDNSYDFVKLIKHNIKRYEPSYVIGIGGGKVLDTVKFACYETEKPFINVPTALTNDGISSPIAVIKSGNDIKSLGANPPLGIIIDIDIIRNSSRTSLLSGIGDLISNISAIEDWNIAYKYGFEKFNNLAQILAKNATYRIINLLLYNKLSIYDERFIIALAEGLIQSGLAMSIAGSSRPCSGAEHLISHALDKVLKQPRPHGIQVGFATLFTMALRGIDIKYICDIYDAISFPRTLTALNITKSEFIDAVKIAPMMRKGRFTILDIVSEKDIADALKIAYGESL